MNAFKDINSKDLLDDLKEQINITNNIKIKYDFAYYCGIDYPSDEYARLAQQYLKECIDEDYDTMWSSFYLASSMQYITKDDDPLIIELWKAVYNDEENHNNDVSSIACYELGTCYSQGIGTDIDFKKAYEWFKKGIDKSKFVDNYIGIGDCYFNGRHVKQDYKYAFKIFNDALKISYEYPNVVTNYESSRAKALGKIGKCYLYGYGIDKNIHKAIEYLEGSIDVFDFELDSNDDSITNDLKFAKSLLENDNEK